MPRKSPEKGLSMPKAPLNSNFGVAMNFSCDQPPTEFKGRNSMFEPRGLELAFASKTTDCPMPAPIPPAARPRKSSPDSSNLDVNGIFQSVAAVHPVASHVGPQCWRDK